VKAIEAENSVVVERPRETVFAFLADGTNDPQWRPAVVDIAREGGEGVGTVYRQGVKGPMGRRVAADYEITQWEPGRRIGFRAIAGPVRPEGSYDLADDGQATRVTMRLGVELQGAARLLSPMVRRSMEAEVAALERLREALAN